MPKAKDIDDAKLKAFLRLKPTLKDTAAFFEVHPDTIENYITRKYQLTFSEFREQNMVHTRHDLIRKAIHMAMQGNTAMMIFALKNLCGWTDKQDIQVTPPKPFIIERLSGAKEVLGAVLEGESIDPMLLKESDE